jgi:hypothetical protein
VHRQIVGDGEPEQPVSRFHERARTSSQRQ